MLYKFHCKSSNFAQKSFSSRSRKPRRLKAAAQSRKPASNCRLKAAAHVWAAAPSILFHFFQEWGANCGYEKRELCRHFIFSIICVYRFCVQYIMEKLEIQKILVFHQLLFIGSILLSYFNFFRIFLSFSLISIIPQIAFLSSCHFYILTHFLKMHLLIQGNRIGILK